jgi:hypothetical protein
VLNKKTTEKKTVIMSLLAATQAFSDKKSAEEAAGLMVDALTDIERRKEALSAAPVPKPAAIELPLPDSVKVHGVFLVNMCNVGQHPSADMPGFRVLGGFEGPDDLKDHVEENLQGHDCALHMVQQGRPFVICRTLEAQRDPQYAITRGNEIIAWHEAKWAEEAAEFKKNVENKTPGEVGKSIKALKEKAKKSQKKVSARQVAYKATRERRLEAKKACRAKNLPRNAEIRNQSVAVVDILVDCDPMVWKGKKSAETVVTLWGVFPSDEEADKFMAYYGGSSNMQNKHMYSIPMYDWNYPETKDDFDIPERSRNPEQEKIMQRMKSEKKEIDKFKQEAALRGNPVPEEGKTVPLGLQTKMYDAKGKELPVLRGAQPFQKPELGQETVFPVLPKDPDFLQPVAQKSAELVAQ